MKHDVEGGHHVDIERRRLRYFGSTNAEFGEHSRRPSVLTWLCIKGVDAGFQTWRVFAIVVHFRKERRGDVPVSRTVEARQRRVTLVAAKKRTVEDINGTRRKGNAHQCAQESGNDRWWLNLVDAMARMPPVSTASPPTVMFGRSDSCRRCKIQSLGLLSSESALCSSE